MLCIFIDGLIIAQLYSIIPSISAVLTITFSYSLNGFRIFYVYLLMLSFFLELTAILIELKLYVSVVKPRLKVSPGRSTEIKTTD